MRRSFQRRNRPFSVIGESRSDHSGGGDVQAVGQRVADRQIRAVTIETGDPVVGSIEQREEDGGRARFRSFLELLRHLADGVDEAVERDPTDVESVGGRRELPVGVNQDRRVGRGGRESPFRPRIGGQ
jgi:hypothetical protein